MAQDPQRPLELPLVNAAPKAQGLVLEVRRFPRELLRIAQSLMDQGEHSLAIVVAHMACEVTTERKLLDAYIPKKETFPEAEAEAAKHRYNLGNPDVRKSYTEVTGDHVEKECWWSRFVESEKRRNDVAHRGRVFEAADAEKTLQVVDALLAHMKL